MCNNSVENSSYCGPYTLNDVTSNRQFSRDYAHAINLYAEDCDYPKEIHQIPPLKMLLSYAEKEFEKEFSKPPTHAAFAPAHVNLCGENTDFNDGKVLSMATQLVTVIVGTRRAARRRCKVKTLSREIGGENCAEFSISSTFDTSDEPSWVNYIKAVVRSFAISKEHIPGFKALIISSIPIKSGLGSSSALTVATYTFLEAITNVHTLNNLEKSIACQQAEEFYIQVPCSIGDTLLSVVGVEGQVIEFDPRSLQVESHDWNPWDIDLILINSTQDAIGALVYQKYLEQCRKVTFALNLASLRDATIPKLVMVKHLFSSKLIKRAHHIISETSRVTKAVELVKECHWKELGKVMWESHCSMRDNFRSSCVKVEYIMGAIQNIDGVYGAKIIGRGWGGFVLVMVHRRGVKKMVKALSRVAECQEYQVIRPSSGAGILYTDGNYQPLQSLAEKRCAKKAEKHHLLFGEYESYELHHDAIYGVSHDKSFTPLKAMSIKTL